MAMCSPNLVLATVNLCIKFEVPNFIFIYEKR